MVSRSVGRVVGEAGSQGENDVIGGPQPWHTSDHLQGQLQHGLLGSPRVSPGAQTGAFLSKIPGNVDAEVPRTTS